MSRVYHPLTHCPAVEFGVCPQISIPLTIDKALLMVNGQLPIVIFVMQERPNYCWAAAVALVFLFCALAFSSQAPAGPPLKLNVDRTIIRTGERVRLSILPRTLASQFSFAIGFQDGPIELLPVGQTEIEHEYRIPGSYSISVTSPLPIPEISNNGIKVQVDRIPLTVEPRSVKEGDPVTFRIGFDATKDAATSYRFTFGDGSSTGWRDVPEVTYTYAEPEIYVATGAVLRKGWDQPIESSPAEVRVEIAQPLPEAVEGKPETSGSSRRWSIILIGLTALAVVAFAVLKTWQWNTPPKLTYEHHRGVRGNIENKAPLEVVMEIVLIPGIESGRHYVGKLEVKRVRD